VIEATDLVVRRGPRTVLEGVSIAIEPGEIVAVLGPNGSGKSTLVGALAGELRPVRGEVKVDGRAVGAWDARALARRRAVLRQDSAFAEPFRVREVVRFGRSPWRDTADVRDAAVDRAMARADVAHLADRPFTALSGGERQRVHLARVLAQVDGGADPAPRALLLDEPASHLDPGHQHALLALLRALAREGAAALVVLHDPNLALAYADRAVVLDAGRVAADDDPVQALAPGLVARVFGVRVLACAGPRPGRPALVAIPEDEPVATDLVAH